MTIQDNFNFNTWGSKEAEKAFIYVGGGGDDKDSQTKFMEALREKLPEYRFFTLTFKLHETPNFTLNSQAKDLVEFISS